MLIKDWFPPAILKEIFITEGTHIATTKFKKNVKLGFPQNLSAITVYHNA